MSVYVRAAKCGLQTMVTD